MQRAVAADIAPGRPLAAQVRAPWRPVDGDIQGAALHMLPRAGGQLPPPVLAVPLPARATTSRPPGPRRGCRPGSPRRCRARSPRDPRRACVRRPRPANASARGSRESTGVTAVRTRPARPAVPWSTCRPRISTEDRGSRQPISSLACRDYRQCAWSDSRGFTRMRARGCRQRGSKQGAYRRAARSAACLASGHMIVWPRHSARVTRTPAATRASRGHMIVWPTSSRLVIVWPTSSRPRRAGTAATHVWRCAPRVDTWSCGHVKPRHARRSAASRCQGTQDAQGRQVERPGASAPRSAAVARAPWSTPAGQRAFAQLSGRRAGRRPAGRRPAGARPRGHSSAKRACSDVPCSDVPGPFRTHIGTSAV
jgi:hypothetical protein